MCLYNGDNHVNVNDCHYYKGEFVLCPYQGSKCQTVITVEDRLFKAFSANWWEFFQKANKWRGLLNGGVGKFPKEKLGIETANGN